MAFAAPDPTSPDLLEMRGVSKTYGRTVALQGLELSVPAGEFVTVVGPSGCGKSTLFNMVAGLEEPDAGGTMRFKGRVLPMPRSCWARSPSCRSGTCCCRGAA